MKPVRTAKLQSVKLAECDLEKRLQHIIRTTLNDIVQVALIAALACCLGGILRQPWEDCPHCALIGILWVYHSGVISATCEDSRAVGRKLRWMWLTEHVLVILSQDVLAECALRILKISGWEREIEMRQTANRRQNDEFRVAKSDFRHVLPLCHSLTPSHFRPLSLLIPQSLFFILPLEL